MSAIRAVAARPSHKNFVLDASLVSQYHAPPVALATQWGAYEYSRQNVSVLLCAAGISGR